MIRYISLLGAGILIGVAGTRASAPLETSTISRAPEKSVSSCEAYAGRIRSLELEVSRLREAATGSRIAAQADAPASESTPLAEPRSPEVSEQPSGEDEAIKWRVSSIEKFVPLTEDQRERLAGKFSLERGGLRGDEQTESLEDILGAENASYYRDQVRAAFERVEEEALEKDIVWLSRQLNLSSEQERLMRSVFASIEQELDGDDAGDGHAGGSSRERMKAMMEENRRRSALRVERMREVLSADQYQAFLRLESESSGADMEVFHGGGDT